MDAISSEKATYIKNLILELEIENSKTNEFSHEQMVKKIQKILEDATNAVKIN